MGILVFLRAALYPTLLEVSLIFQRVPSFWTCGLFPIVSWYSNLVSVILTGAGLGGGEAAKSGNAGLEGESMCNFY